MRKHGTTHERPLEVFTQVERAAMLPLPAVAWLAAALDELVGEPILAELRSAQAAYGDALGITAERTVPRDISLRRAEMERPSRCRRTKISRSRRPPRSRRSRTLGSRSHTSSPYTASLLAVPIPTILERQRRPSSAVESTQAMGVAAFRVLVFAGSKPRARGMGRLAMAHEAPRE